MINSLKYSNILILSNTYYISIFVKYFVSLSYASIFFIKNVK